MNPSSSPPDRRTRRVVLTGVALAVAVLIASSAWGTLASSSPAQIRGEATAFDDVPAVTRLDPDLLRALRAAAADAATDGIELHINSGWRSGDHQGQLLREAISRYGSRQEAARWVATPQTSPHVSGDAVDVGEADATSWLAQHGRAYDLCQIYANESWHYELRPGASVQGCPALYADPTHDPRMRR